MKSLLPALLFFCLLPVVSKADFRINLLAPGGIAFADIAEGLTGIQGGWLKEKKDTYLAVYAPLSSGEKIWSVSILPKRDGRLTIQLVTTGRTGTVPERALCSDLHVNGADLRNGTLSEVANGKPVGWSAVRKAEFRRTSGKNYLLCDDLNYWTQTIPVKRGRMVHLQLSVRKDLP